jgi:hypothetical protein
MSTPAATTAADLTSEAFAVMNEGGRNHVFAFAFRAKSARTGLAFV